MATLEQLFAVEKNLEDGFLAAFVVEGFNPDALFRRRDPRTGDSRRIEVLVTLADVANHVHNFNDQVWTWDTWNGQLETAIYTNRTTEGQFRTHVERLGRVRLALQLFRLVNSWKNPFATFTDIREAGSVNAEDKDKNLDITTITWTLLANIRTDAWALVTS